MIRSNHICAVFPIYTLLFLHSVYTKRGAYIAVEHPTVTYFNPKYMADVEFTSKRYSRRDPMYYIHMQAKTLIPWDNNITVHFYSVEYPRDHVIFEQHYKWCNLILKDKIIGTLLRKFVPKTCPTPKGFYQIANMTTLGLPIPFIEHLPYNMARLYINASILHEKLAEAHFELEIKRNLKQ